MCSFCIFVNEQNLKHRKTSSGRGRERETKRESDISVFIEFGYFIVDIKYKSKEKCIYIHIKRWKLVLTWPEDFSRCLSLCVMHGLWMDHDGYSWIESRSILIGFDQTNTNFYPEASLHITRKVVKNSIKEIQQQKIQKIRPEHFQNGAAHMWPTMPMRNCWNGRIRFNNRHAVRISLNFIRKQSNWIANRFQIWDFPIKSPIVLQTNQHKHTHMYELNKSIFGLEFLRKSKYVEKNQDENWFAAGHKRINFFKQRKMLST